MFVPCNSKTFYGLVVVMADSLWVYFVMRLTCQYVPVINLQTHYITMGNASNSASAENVNVKLTITMGNASNSASAENVNVNNFLR